VVIVPLLYSGSGVPRTIVQAPDAATARHKVEKDAHSRRAAHLLANHAGRFVGRVKVWGSSLDEKSPGPVTKTKAIGTPRIACATVLMECPGVSGFPRKIGDRHSAVDRKMMSRTGHVV